MRSPVNRPGHGRTRTQLVLVASVVAGMLEASSCRVASADPAQCGPWGFVPSPAPASGTASLYGVGALSASDAWAVGSNFTTAQINGINYSVTMPLTMHWDGTAWSIVPSPNASSPPEQNILQGIEAISSNDVWVVGSRNETAGTGGPVSQTLALHWNGAAWSIVPSPIIVIASLSGGSSFNAVSALASNNIWAVGMRAMSSPGPVEAPLAARWDGTAWNEVSAPYVGNRVNRLFGVSARTSSDVWAVGTWRSLSTAFHILILHWNGTAWSVTPAPDPGNNDELLAVVALSPNDAWAVGDRNDPVTGSQPLIVHWNGSSWSMHPLPEFPAEFNRLNAIRAVTATDIWATGATAAVAGGPSEALLMHWNGTAWSTVPAAPTGGASEYFNGLAIVSGCDVWAAGSFLDAASLAPLTERLNASPIAGVIDATPNWKGGERLSNLRIVPNPSYGTSTILLTTNGRVQLETVVFDSQGRLVRALGRHMVQAGENSVTWDGRDGRGAPVPAGIYFVRVSTPADARTGRVLIVH